MSPLLADPARAAAIAEKLKVFAQPQRLAILACLLDGERRVSELAERAGIRQPALSQQLAELRRAGLVSTRKQSKQVWYALADATVERCMRNLEAFFGEDQNPAQDRDQRGPALPAHEPAARAPRRGTAGFAQLLPPR